MKHYKFRGHPSTPGLAGDLAVDLDSETFYVHDGTIWLIADRYMSEYRAPKSAAKKPRPWFVLDLMTGKTAAGGFNAEIGAIATARALNSFQSGAIKRHAIERAKEKLEV